jgi:hypothetical protein
MLIEGTLVSATNLLINEADLEKGLYVQESQFLSGLPSGVHSHETQRKKRLKKKR